MWYLLDAVANQREREIAARTRSPLFTQQPSGVPSWPRKSRRSERDRAKLPALSMKKWRRWARRDQVPCSRAASLVGC